MPVGFEDIKIDGPNGEYSPLEVTLYEGIFLNLSGLKPGVASEISSRGKKSNNSGIVFVCYPFRKTEDFIAATLDRPQGKPSPLGGLHIHKDAIYNLEFLSRTG